MKENVRCVTKVTESILIDRINRKLSVDSQSLKESRMTGSPSFGLFYDHPTLISETARRTDLESIGRVLGVLLPGEHLGREN